MFIRWLLLILLVLSSCVKTPQNEKETTLHSVKITEFASDGAWCWFADPRAVYYEGKHRRTYVGWIDSFSDIRIAYYDHDKGIIFQAPEPLRKSLLNNSGKPDDHSNPAILFLPDGRLMVFYSGHNGPSMWYRISKLPENITEWESEREFETNTSGEEGYTYPNPVMLSAEDNRIYLFWRGGNCKPSFSVFDDGLNWSPSKTLIEGSGRRPYIKFASNGVDEIHFAFTDGHPGREPENNIYYACYRDGAFYRTDGSLISSLANLPFAPADADKVYNAAASGHGRAWIWDIALDAEDHPVIVYSAMPEETEHFYCYARWTGSQWQEYQVVSAGGGWFPQTQAGKQESEPHYSGGIVLDHQNPAVVYLSRKLNGVFEIERWCTPDGGKSWSSSAVTTGSKANNVRPCVARGHKGETASLFWMQGNYVHYTEYSTAIMMR
ncbi:MAG: BNR repeat-containing protein [Gemmatimonadota bacterium]|nr:BNR repeat-containing protein [Gemmatimonadota bacterium]